MRRFLIAVAGVLVLLLARQIWRMESPNAPAPNSPRRLVSLAPNLTGLLFELGVGDQVVGVTRYCDYPAEAGSREQIGDFINPSLEKMVALRPDLILAERWPSSRTVERLRQLQLPVQELASPNSLEEIYRLVVQVGELVECEPEAAALVARMRRQADSIAEVTDGFPFRPGLYLEIDLPTWTVGRPSFSSEAIRFCGARNIFDDLEMAAPQVSQEEIIFRNPAIIVSFAATAEQIRRRPGWSGIEAVRQGRIIDDFEEALLSRGNHRLLVGMEQLQQRIRETMDFP